MTLKLTKGQKEYFDKSGLIDARTLQRVFEKSVQDQEKLKKQAAKIRAKRSK
jgi:hypothetical protein